MHVPRASGGCRPDEVARYLFRKVVSWGRSSNVFLRNGARLYLDVGSHPEYATPECDDIVDLVAHDKAGERILEGLLVDAEQRLHDEGIAGDDLPVQEQHRLGRQLLRLPRELPGRPARRVQPARRRADPVPGDPADHRAAPARCCRPRAARSYCREPARRAHLGGRLVSATTRSPADHQHPRRAARRRRALPPAARHRRRLEHERDHHAAQGRQLRPRAADDRGGRGDARPHAGEPDPGDPRDLATTSPAAARSGWPTAARPARWTSSRSTSPRPATSSTAARSRRR